MKKAIINSISVFFLFSCINVFASNKSKIAPNDCNYILSKVIKHSNFEYTDSNYFVRIEDISDDSIIIKAYVRDNLSDDPKHPHMVESAIAWFVIQPQRDGIYQSMGALNPDSIEFRKLNIDSKMFQSLLKCIDKK
ncbi:MULTISPECIES: hypothetical protein [Myroides]|nr:MULTISPECIES: hypothetical protein [Myroides]UVD80503.1 hypothetical protein NWE55_04325 [Myroides albus]